MEKMPQIKVQVWVVRNEGPSPNHDLNIQADVHHSVRIRKKLSRSSLWWSGGHLNDLCIWALRNRKLLDRRLGYTNECDEYMNSI